MRDGDVDDVRPVLRLAADDERLGEVQADDLGAHLHRPDERSRYSGREATYAATSAAALSGGEPGRHDPAAGGDDRLDLRRGQADAVERRPDPTGCVGTVTAGARRGEHLAPARRVAGRRCGPAHHSRGRERMPDREADGRERHGDESERWRELPPRHQNPNRTFVKYQSAEVSHRTARIVASDPPSTGSTQWG